MDSTKHHLRPAAPLISDVRRLAVLAAIALIHLLVILQLAKFRPAAGPASATDYLSVSFISSPPATPSPPGAAPLQSFEPPLDLRPSERAITPSYEPSAEPPAAPTDWMAEGRRSASSALVEQAPARRLGPDDTPRAPELRSPEPFPWDKTQTEHVSKLPQGGLLVRLSEKCSLVIAPLPLGGCTLGKRAARGDLFGGMEQPAELGDWKEDDGPP